MKLKLEYPPSPEHASKHAAIIVDAMRENEQLTLDYSLESLRQVDAVLAKLHGLGATVERIPSILFRAGCYTGEVFRRQCPSSVWANPAETIACENIDLFPFIVLKHANGNVWAPVNKAFAVLESPETNSLHFSCSAELAKVGAPPQSFWSRVRKRLS